MVRESIPVHDVDGAAVAGSSFGVKASNLTVPKSLGYGFVEFSDIREVS